MARPCNCDNVTGPEYTRDQCLLCWQYRYNERYRKLWDGETPARTKSPKKPSTGPGSQLKAMLLEINAKPSADCGCDSLAKKMNAWGVEGCRERRYEIAAQLQENAAELNLLQLFGAAIWSLKASWVSAINPLHPFLSLLDESIRRAESESAADTS